MFRNYEKELRVLRGRIVDLEFENEMYTTGFGTGSTTVRKVLKAILDHLEVELKSGPILEKIKKGGN